MAEYDHGHALPEPLRGFEHINRYWDARMDVPAAKILPGECYVSSRGEMISTVLGSCISACIRDPVLGIGGMNHFMLPVQAGEKGIQRMNSTNPALCYGNWAMEFLINSILKQGGRKDRLEVKLFGGGRVLAGMTHIDIGRRNIDFVLDFLDKEQLRVRAEDLGGDYPRKVLYFADTGAVKMRRIRTVANDTIEQRELAYMDSMNKKPQAGGVELF
jgi:chemotaxis protein CheD